MAAKAAQVKAAAKGGRQAAKHQVLFDLPLGSVFGAGGGAPSKKDKGGGTGKIIAVGGGVSLERALELLERNAGVTLSAWQRDRFAKRRHEAFMVAGSDGPAWLVAPPAILLAPSKGMHRGLLDQCGYAVFRDLIAPISVQAVEHCLSELILIGHDWTESEAAGAGVGLQVGAYRYKTLRQPASVPPRPILTITGDQADAVDVGITLGAATNLARHLVNMPPAELNPESYAAAVAGLFHGSTTAKVEIWDPKRLEKERLGLLLAVGRGAEHGARLVHIRYRPKKARSARPVAFVGKGVTFDSGGLDLKDAASMRLMKKDMGGSASVLALAWWAETAGVDLNLDFYLALAENAVDRESFHPGDVLTARNGLTVEIDNTDAEGRLVMADAFDVAISQKGKDAPAALFDLATLTGAMRIAVGTRIAGMFASDDKLADAVLSAGQMSGDPLWRLPLYQEYLPQLKSTVADIANSGPGRFGGAITAALFLSRFAGEIPWVHIDMYAWTEGGGIGGMTEPGGNGQCVQALSRILASHDFR